MLYVPSQRVVLARYSTPTGEIQLQQRPLVDGTLVFEIIVDGVFLMASYNQASERALARYALDTLPDAQPDLRLLVGGLGMGFTLQEVLSSDNVVAVDVVEISPHIVEWNHTHFAPLNNHALAAPRVNLIRDDLYAVLDAQFQRDVQYHAILLDVDNGPSWLAHEDNARLYTTEALQRWSALLFPGGCLTVWSAQCEPRFLARLRAVLSQAEEIPVEVTNEKGLVGQFVYRAVTA
jgi:spermidine synthase